MITKDNIIKLIDTNQYSLLKSINIPYKMLYGVILEKTNTTFGFERIGAIFNELKILPRQSGNSYLICKLLSPTSDSDILNVQCIASASIDRMTIYDMRRWVVDHIVYHIQYGSNLIDDAIEKLGGVYDSEFNDILLRNPIFVADIIEQNHIIKSGEFSCVIFNDDIKYELLHIPNESNIKILKDGYCIEQINFDEDKSALIPFIKKFFVYLL